MPLHRKRVLQPGGVGYLSGAGAAKEAAREQVLLADLPRVPDRGRPCGTLVLQQPLQYADRGMERRPGRPVLRFAVPSAVVELLTEQPGDDAVNVLAEVRADRDGAAVDARFDLAFEERLTGVLPPAVFPDTVDGRADGGVARVDAKVAKQPQGRQRGGPWLTVRITEDWLGWSPVGAGEAGAAGPMTVALQVQQSFTRPGLGHPSTFRGHLGCRCVGEVAKDLPPDRRIGIKQPGQHLVHRAAPSVSRNSRRITRRRLVG